MDFREFISESVGRCAILLALIGPAWLTITDGRGRRRLHDPGDFVRIEIETALQRDILVIPLLVNGAGMPAEVALPSSLQDLADATQHSFGATQTFGAMWIVSSTTSKPT